MITEEDRSGPSGSLTVSGEQLNEVGDYTIVDATPPPTTTPSSTTTTTTTSASLSAEDYARRCVETGECRSSTARSDGGREQEAPAVRTVDRSSLAQRVRKCLFFGLCK